MHFTTSARRRQHALAILATLATNAASYGFGGYGAPFPGRVGPYSTNSTEWLDAVAASNSTGLFHIPGYDVSKPYPAKTIDGWTLSVAVVDVPNKPSNPVSYYQGSAERMVGYSMTVQAPDSLIKTAADGTKVVDVDPTWGMCIWNWETPGYSNRSLYNNPGNKSLAQDGSCAGFIPDACIVALEKAASTNYLARSEPLKPFGSLVSCSSLEIPSECGVTVGNVSSSLPSYSGVPLKYLNGSVTAQDGWEQSTSDNYTQADFEEMWDSLVLNFWPVLTLFVNATADNSSLKTNPGFARMNCIAPNGMGTGRFYSHTGSSPNAAAPGGGNGTSTGSRAAALQVPGGVVLGAIVALMLL